MLTSFGDRRDRSQFAAVRRSRFRHHHRSARRASGLCRADHLHRPRRDPGGYREFQTGDERGGDRGRFHERGRPLQRIAHRHQYYKTEEELLFACADAMREEYKAILDAGLGFW